jgi:hypothetical protein
MFSDLDLLSVCVSSQLKREEIAKQGPTNKAQATAPCLLAGIEAGKGSREMVEN